MEHTQEGAPGLHFCALEWGPSPGEAGVWKIWLPQCRPRGFRLTMLGGDASSTKAWPNSAGI